MPRRQKICKEKSLSKQEKPCKKHTAACRDGNLPPYGHNAGRRFTPAENYAIIHPTQKLATPVRAPARNDKGSTQARVFYDKNSVRLPRQDFIVERQTRLCHLIPPFATGLCHLYYSHTTFENNHILPQHDTKPHSRRPSGRRLCLFVHHIGIYRLTLSAYSFNVVLISSSFS